VIYHAANSLVNNLGINVCELIQAFAGSDLKLGFMVGDVCRSHHNGTVMRAEFMFGDACTYYSPEIRSCRPRKCLIVTILMDAIEFKRYLEHPIKAVGTYTHNWMASCGACLIQTYRGQADIYAVLEFEGSPGDLHVMKYARLIPLEIDDGNKTIMMHTYIHTHTRTSTHEHAHTHTYTHTHTHTHAHTLTHAQSHTFTSALRPHTLMRARGHKYRVRN